VSGETARYGDETDLAGGADRNALLERYRSIRAASLELRAPLSPEDCQVQSMPDVSPTKWHLAHTAWFFDAVVLEPRPGYAPSDPAFRVLYNSYYNSLGAQHPRPERGLVTRPGLDEVLRYRDWVDGRMGELIERSPERELAELADLVEIGVNHEQQHQELLLMDIKHVFSCNPLRPAYRTAPPRPQPAAQALAWIEHPGGVHEVGHEGPGFAYDNEGPRHEVLLRPFRLASRLVTNAEFLEFVESGGYSRPELWLSDGWATIQAEGWRGPLYWEPVSGGWQEFTLGGTRPLVPDAPVAHVSYYEADAFARWRQARLPSEHEWEVVARTRPVEGNFVGAGVFHPLPAPPGFGDAPVQLFGDLWEWTASPYTPYPGYRPVAGPLGEYNGKFMCNQFVLRGGACVTADGHVRPTYRNFFYPHTRWHFSGIRLAEDAW